MAVSHSRYSAAFTCWRKCEQDTNGKTKKFFRIYVGLYPKTDADRLYNVEKMERKKFDIHWRLCRVSNWGFEKYIYGSYERLTQTTIDGKIDWLEATCNTSRQKRKGSLQN